MCSVRALLDYIDGFILLIFINQNCSLIRKIDFSHIKLETLVRSFKVCDIVFPFLKLCVLFKLLLIGQTIKASRFSLALRGKNRFRKKVT